MTKIQFNFPQLQREEAKLYFSKLIHGGKKTYPVITELYAAIKEFYEILYSRRDERLETWLEKIENFNIPELQTYVNGIRIDINAVKNGIKLKYNNGLAEGSVNKIKVIKRIMYGRNSFDLLKAKVLLHEHFRCEFN